jgi:hypothetical protein
MRLYYLQVSYSIKTTFRDNRVVETPEVFVDSIPIISFCIPTNGRVEILKKTLESFFIDNAYVDTSLYEICIADNSPTNETGLMLRDFPSKPNIVYKKNSSSGFLNSVQALKLGRGKFLKLNNNTNFFKENMLGEIIRIIESHENTMPVIFFLSRYQQDEIIIDSFDTFLSQISYFSTSSSCFGIWREDFEKLNTNICVNTMFPHTSFLFESYPKSQFIIDNRQYYDTQSVPKKGGYHLTKTFCVDYIEMINILFENNIITQKTYKQLKKELLYDFFADWYTTVYLHKKDYTFDISNTGKLLKINYTYSEILLFYFSVVILMTKKIYHSIKEKK